MGCGACACNDSLAVVSPTKVTLQNKIASKINRLKLKQSYLAFLITQQQINQLNQWLAAHKKLSALRILRQRSVGESAELLTKLQRTVWKILLLCPQPSNKLQSGYLAGIKYQGSLLEADELVENSFNQISLDINRTYPEIKALDRKSLQNVLRNLAAHFVGVGYTQGMNFYAGFLLQCGFSAEEAFYLLAAIYESQQYLLIEIFSPTFRLVTKCLEYLDKKSKLNINLTLKDFQYPKCNQCSEISVLFPVNFNNLASILAQLQENGITPHLYSFSWFLTVFLYVLKPESCVLIWDHMIKSGRGICVVSDIAVIILCILAQQWIDKKQNLKEEVSEKNISLMEFVKGDKIKQQFNTQSIYQIILMLKELQHLKEYHQTSMNPIIDQILCKQSDIYGIDRDLQEITTKRTAYEQYINNVRTLEHRKTPGNNHGHGD